MRAHVVVGLGFGDEGKGTMVDYLTRQAKGPVTVVRFNGGSQAGHNVVLPDGRHHTFAQFGSGTLLPNCSTHLSRFMLVDPITLMNEHAHLVSLGCPALHRLTISENALVITEYHKRANVLRERRRGAAAHGTCGMGIGETQMLSTIEGIDLRMGELYDIHSLRNRLTRIRDYYEKEFDCSDWPHEVDCSDWPHEVAVAMELHEIAQQLAVVPEGCPTGDLVFEGAQGVLLDEFHGFHPHTTWSTTTPHNARTLLKEWGWTGTVETIGVTRTYHTRHGRGPFPTEGGSTVAEPHNGPDGSQGAFRQGPLDLMLLNYAIQACGGVDVLAVTHFDAPSRPVCVGYELDGKPIHQIPRKVDLEDWSEAIQRVKPVMASGVIKMPLPVKYASSGPTYRDKWEKAE
jgi:adenylosuccinate synthase